MKLIKKSILLLALAGGTFLSGGKAYAQQALVDVRVDSAAILIGEQTVLHLTVTTVHGYHRPVLCLCGNGAAGAAGRL